MLTDTANPAAMDSSAAASHTPPPDTGRDAAPPPAGGAADPKPSKKKRQHKKRHPGDRRPTVTEAAGHMSDILDQIEAALVARGGLYQRAGLIVYPAPAGADRPAPTITERGEHALVEDISGAVRLMRYDARADDDVERDPSPRIVRVLMARRDRLRLPTLSAIISAPTLRPDGTVLDTPGYDAATGLFLDVGTTAFPPIPSTPSRDEASRALATLCELLQHFPFATPADRSVALSGILTALVRPSLPTAPLHGISATVAGSGKSKLIDIIAAIAIGYGAAVIPQPQNIEELEKRLNAELLDGAPIITIDNCTAPIDGNTFCAMLTQKFVKVRILGTSTSVAVASTAFVAATGNNLVIAGDMTRRAVVCRIDPGVEQPELLTFPFEPVSRATADRGRYVAAALTILRAYATAGRPHQVRPLGSFEAWSDSVRSALMWLGCADPCATMNVARQRDPTLQDCIGVAAEWRAVVGDRVTTVRDLIEHASRPAGIGTGYAHPGLRDALLAVAERGGEINRRALGRWLSGQAGRVVGEWRFNEVGQSNGSNRYRLERHERSREGTREGTRFAHGLSPGA